MNTKQAILKFSLLAALTLTICGCTSKEAKYSDVVQYAKDFLQISRDGSGEYQKTFYKYLDTTLPADLTQTWLNGMFIPWGKDPRSIIELTSLTVKKHKDHRLFSLKLSVTRISEQRYFNYKIDIKKSQKGMSITDFSAIEHKITPAE